MKFYSFILTLFLLFPAISLAQHQVQISLYPGYHLINSDKPAVGDNAYKTNWIFGGTVSLITEYQGHPVEITAGYSEGNSIVYTFISTAEHFDPPTYDIELRYRTLPVDALYSYQISERVTLLGGINMAAQHRVLQYDESFNISNDRLLSFGVGLSGKMRATLSTFKSGNGAVFGSLSARWTEYIIHNKRGRKLDDFTLRHLTVYPEIGVKLDINVFR